MTKLTDILFSIWVICLILTFANMALAFLVNGNELVPEYTAIGGYEPVNVLKLWQGHEEFLLLFMITSPVVIAGILYINCENQIQWLMNKVKQLMQGS